MFDQRELNLSTDDPQPQKSRMAAVRQRRRSEGLCAACGKRSEKYRCRRCTKRFLERRKSKSVALRSSVTRRPIAGGVIQPKVKLEHRIEADGRERTRVRYIGRAVRGAPSKDQIEAEDVRNLRFAIREIEKAIPQLAATTTAELAALPRIQRAAVRNQALAPVDLAMRLLDETLDRNKYGQEAQERLARSQAVALQSSVTKHGVR